MRESKWYSIDVCSKCEHRLTDWQLMNSNGTCAHCGHKCDSTVCDYEKVVLKSTKHYKWWEFWKNKKTYVGKDEFSKRWLNER